MKKYDDLDEAESLRGDEQAAWMSLGDLPSMDLNAKGVGVVDRYELIEKLGQGGFGAVYGARDTEAGILVALKALPAEVSCDESEMKAIRKNFALVSRLHHPHIASVLHLHRVENPDARATSKMGIKNGDYLVVMEYAAGATLSAFRSAMPDEKMTLFQALEYARPIAAALDYAHAEKVLHRDIKPQNIIISREDGLRVKVLDFGLAAEIRSSMSRKSKDPQDSKSGTPNYMAPEQWRGKRQDGRADQYALAATIYELLSGEVAFKSAFDTGNHNIMRDVVVTETVEPIDELTKKQNAVLLRALSKEPDARFGSCGEFVSALGGGRVSRKAAKPQRKSAIFNRKSAILLGLLVAGLLGLGVYTSHRASTAQAAQTTQETRVLLAAAQAALRSSDFAAATEQAQAVLRLNPNHSAAAELLLEIEKRAGERNARTIKIDTEMAVEKLEREITDRGQGFGEKLDSLKRELLIAQDAYASRSWGQAFTAFKGVDGACAALRAREVSRKDAKTQRGEMEGKRRGAEAQSAESLAKEEWKKGVGAALVASRSFEKGKFEEASKGWKNAAKSFQTLETLSGKISTAMQLADDGKKAAEAAKAETLAKEFWAEGTVALASATTAQQAGQYEEALSAWAVANETFQQAAVRAENMADCLVEKAEWDQLVEKKARQISQHKWLKVADIKEQAGDVWEKAETEALLGKQALAEPAVAKEHYVKALGMVDSCVTDVLLKVRCPWTYVHPDRQAALMKRVAKDAVCIDGIVVSSVNVVSMLETYRLVPSTIYYDGSQEMLQFSTTELIAQRAFALLRKWIRSTHGAVLPITTQSTRDIVAVMLSDVSESEKRKQFGLWENSAVDQHDMNAAMIPLNFLNDRDLTQQTLELLEKQAELPRHWIALAKVQGGLLLRYDEAERLLEKAESSSKIVYDLVSVSEAWVALFNDTERARKIFGDAPTHNGGISTGPYLALMNIQIFGDVDRARQCMLQADQAGSVYVWSEIASKWWDLFGDDARALQAMHQAEKSVVSGVTWITLARVWKQYAHNSAKVEYCLDQVEKDKSSKYVWPQLAEQCFREFKGTSRAREWLLAADRKIIKIKGLGPSWADIAKAWGTLGEKSRAVQCVEKAESSAKNSIDWSSCATAWCQIGEKSRAVQCLEKAERIAKSPVFLSVCVGPWVQVGEKDRAVACLKKMERMAGNSLDWTYCVQAWLRSLEDIENARRCLEQAEHKAKETYEWSLCAVYWEQIGDQEGAAACKKKAGK